MLTDLKKPAVTRQYPRYDFSSTIQYKIDAPSSGGEDRIAVVTNISTAGIRALLFFEHPKGQKIFIKSELPVDYHSATVQWIQKKDDGLFLAGLKFVDHASS